MTIAMEENKRVTAYIESFPEETRILLNQFRKLLFTLAPDAEEKISYGMPGYYLKGKPLVYFAAYKNHIGFYATPTGHEKFSIQLAAYKQGKSSVQFPLQQPIPWKLVADIIKFRISENKNHGK